MKEALVEQLRLLLDLLHGRAWEERGDHNSEASKIKAHGETMVLEHCPPFRRISRRERQVAECLPIVVFAMPRHGNENP